MFTKNSEWLEKYTQRPYLHPYTGALSSGFVTFTDGDCRLLLYYYRHVIQQHLYQLLKVQSTGSLSTQIVSDIFLVSRWWRVLPLKSDKSLLAQVVVNPVLVGIYCHMLNRNQLVQLRGKSMCKQTLMCWLKSKWFEVLNPYETFV
jgi:hypothetical protein